VPLFERPPQRHEPGCWRWSNHWRCAVDLVDELASVLAEVQALYATVSERGQIEVVIPPDLYERIEAALAKVEAKPPRSFGKR
jgi:hypothetical protein